MAAVINTDEEIEDYARNGIDVSDPVRIADANSKATDMIRQAAYNRYTPASFELLTAATAPPEMKQKHLYLAAGILSDGDAARSETINQHWDEALAYLGLLVAGRTHYDLILDAILVAHASAGVTHKARRASVFNRDDPYSEFNLVDKPIR